jgi:hypothetical protein
MARIQNEVALKPPTRPVPATLVLWLACQTIGSLLFTATYLIEGATRPGYSTWQQPISALSLGLGGWVQQVNFVVFGAISVFTAFGWRSFLKGGVGATWFPIMRGLEGLAMIIVGIFSQDPANGYPPGVAIPATPTLHAVIHQLFSFVSITALAVSFFILAWRFAKEPSWRGWATYSVITGMLVIVFITTFGILIGQHSGIAGLFERLPGITASILGIIFCTRLWLGAGFGRFQRQVSASASS